MYSIGKVFYQEGKKFKIVKSGFSSHKKAELFVKKHKLKRRGRGWFLGVFKQY